MKRLLLVLVYPLVSHLTMVLCVSVVLMGSMLGMDSFASTDDVPGPPPASSRIGLRVGTEDVLIELTEQATRVLLLRYLNDEAKHEEWDSCSSERAELVRSIGAWIHGPEGMRRTRFGILFVSYSGSSYQFLPLNTQALVVARNTDRITDQFVVGTVFSAWYAMRLDDMATIRDVDFRSLGVRRPLRIRPRKEGELERIDALDPLLFRRLDADVMISVDTTVRAVVGAVEGIPPSLASEQRIQIWVVDDALGEVKLLCTRDLALRFDDMRSLQLTSDNRWGLSD